MSMIILEMKVMFSEEGKVYFNPDNSRFSIYFSQWWSSEGIYLSRSLRKELKHHVFNRALHVVNALQLFSDSEFPGSFNTGFCHSALTHAGTHIQDRLLDPDAQALQLRLQKGILAVYARCASLTQSARIPFYVDLFSCKGTCHQIRDVFLIHNNWMHSL